MYEPYPFPFLTNSSNICRVTSFYQVLSPRVNINPLNNSSLCQGGSCTLRSFNSLQSSTLHPLPGIGEKVQILALQAKGQTPTPRESKLINNNYKIIVKNHLIKNRFCCSLNKHTWRNPKNNILSSYNELYHT